MPDTDQSLEDNDQPVHGSGDTAEPTPDADAEGEGAGEQPDSPPDPAQQHIQSLRRENASWRTRLREKEAELERLKETAASDVEAAVQQAREEARAEALAEALALSSDRIREAEVLAAASKRLRDPADALKLLDLSQFQVDDEGNVDREAIDAAVDELVKGKPYLAATRDPDFGAQPPPERAHSMDDLIRQAAGRG